MNDQNCGVYTSLERSRLAESLFVQNSGYRRCSPEEGWGPGIRTYFRLQHVVRGQGVLICGQRRYLLREGDTFLAYPNTVVHYYADKREPWEYLWVGFGGRDASRIVERTALSPGEPVLWGKDGEIVAELMGEICACGGGEPWQELEAAARLHRLLSHLVRTASVWEEADCALRAAEYIVTHYEEPITVEGLAEYLSVSHSSLYRRFMKRYQTSPKRFLLEYRIRRACELLANTACSIQEVASSVGFEDPFYFSRVFKEINGVSPRQYAADVRLLGEGMPDGG